MTNTGQYAQTELQLLLANSTDPENRPLIEPFIDEIISIADKFGGQGHSETAASYTAETIAEALRKLLMQRPICPLTDSPEDWIFQDVDKEHTVYQHKRLASVMKETETSIPYYLDAIVWKDQQGHKFTGRVMCDNREYASHQCVKFPFRPKTFYVDVVKVKNGKGYFWKVRDKQQLNKVFKHYLLPPTN